MQDNTYWLLSIETTLYVSGAGVCVCFPPALDSHLHDLLSKRTLVLRVSLLRPLKYLCMHTHKYTRARSTVPNKQPTRSTTNL